MKRFVQALNIVFTVILFFSPAEVRAQKATIAATPPMGWNSWNRFA